MKIEEIELERLLPWKNNPRKNDQAVGAVADSIRTFGFNVPILCDQYLNIVAGHTRWKAAKFLGMPKVPVTIISMTETQRHAYAIADNKLGEIADWDFPKLRDIIAELSAEDIGIKYLGFTDEELRKFIIDEASDNEITIERNATEIDTVPGDMYILGDHRLMCGDSRLIGNVKFLVKECEINHIFAGPPYFNQREYSHWENYTAYLDDMRKIITNCFDILKDGALCVWNIANGCSTHHDHTAHHSLIFEKTGFRYMDTIIWKKTGANYAIPRNFHIMRNSCYFPAFGWEALLVYQKPGKMPKMTKYGRDYMVKFHTDVWEISAVTNQVDLYGHPAVCPVEIPYRSILAYTGNGDSLFEPFGGSGTTLIAAEKAARAAFLMEINPAYCDIIVKRWEQFTGKNAVRIRESGKNGKNE